MSFSDFQYFSGEIVHSNAVFNDIYNNSTLFIMNQNDLYILFGDIEKKNLDLKNGHITLGFFILIPRLILTRFLCIKKLRFKQVKNDKVQ